MTTGSDPVDTGQSGAHEPSGAGDVLWREFLDAAPDGIVAANQAGEITLVNRQLEAIFGYGRDELIGQPVEILMPERFRQRHLGYQHGYFAAPRTRPMGIGLDLWGRRKDGTEFPIEISLSPVRGKGVLLVTSSIRDITDRRAAEEELRRTAAALRRSNEELSRSNAELEQFAYVASHDLQEPLRMVASYTQLLARRYRGKLDEDADEFIHFAVDGATRMQRLINDLLSYSRVSRRGRQFEPTEINQVVDQVLNDLHPLIQEAGASVTRGELPRLAVDPSQIRQVFQNLIGNAIKFRGETPPRVDIAAELIEEAWRFQVRDNGIGVDPRYAERVFVLFQRLHTREQYPGTGIGLAVCKKIIERHGGRIWLDSASDRGTTFFFTIPTG